MDRCAAQVDGALFREVVGFYLREGIDKRSANLNDALFGKPRSGDLNGESVKVGVNCFFDPDMCIETVRIMKAALDEAGIKKHLNTQPIGYKTPECLHENLKLGMTGLPEFPFGKVTGRDWSSCEPVDQTSQFCQMSFTKHGSQNGFGMIFESLKSSQRK
ncbi:hypothetical protein QZH41_020009 [Actinostola sp. cb2023]|nr:hypothetical protein QZH41_020009 [Actinostola sp. cb2023]